MLNITHTSLLILTLCMYVTRTLHMHPTHPTYPTHPTHPTQKHAKTCRYIHVHQSSVNTAWWEGGGSVGPMQPPFAVSLATTQTVLPPITWWKIECWNSEISCLLLTFNHHALRTPWVEPPACVLIYAVEHLSLSVSLRHPCINLMGTQCSLHVHECNIFEFGDTKVSVYSYMYMG